MSYNIEQADEQIRVSHNANEPGFATAAATRAVALATLELAEQQRIANLIGLAALPSINGFENEVYDARTAALMEGLLDSETVPAVAGYGPAGIDERVFVRPNVREALGLE